MFSEPTGQLRSDQQNKTMLYNTLKQNVLEAIQPRVTWEGRGGGKTHTHTHTGEAASISLQHVRVSLIISNHVFLEFWFGPTHTTLVAQRMKGPIFQPLPVKR